MYANRDIESDEALERYFYQHLDAMTKEDLRSKAAIAAELAYRDALLERAYAELQLQGRSNSPWWTECM